MIVHRVDSQNLVREIPMQSALESSARNKSIVLMLLPIIAMVFIAFLVIGLAMPVLPLHVHDGLGLGTFAVGIVAGAQFSA